MNWNHLHINNKLIKEIQPDIIIDIRTERFLLIPNSIYNTIKKFDSYDDCEFNNILNYNDIYSILININHYDFFNIIKNVKGLNEIKDNTKLFSIILHSFINLVKPYINIDEKVALSLNKDLNDFYNDKIDKEISFFKLIWVINNENRKYKYENIPEDF